MMNKSILEMPKSVRRKYRKKHKRKTDLKNAVKREISKALKMKMDSCIYFSCTDKRLRKVASNG